MFALQLFLVAILLADTGPSEPRSQNSPTQQIVQLSIETSYGRAAYTSCKTEVLLNPPRSLYTLSAMCELNDNSGTVVSTHRLLSEAEAVELRDLIAKADLFTVPHVGRDETPADGHFITVTLRTLRRAVVSVASGNPAFNKGTPPSDLLTYVLAKQSSGIKDARAKSG